MTREEAYQYWRFKYEAAKDYDDPRWEGGEAREHRLYIDALATVVGMLEPPLTHGDEIRAMSDEELYDLLWGGVCDCIPKCPDGLCSECVHSWLKSPVEVDDGNTL